MESHKIIQDVFQPLQSGFCDKSLLLHRQLGQPRVIAQLGHLFRRLFMSPYVQTLEGKRFIDLSTINSAAVGVDIPPLSFLALDLSFSS